jgi:hypothetical protein
MRSQTFLLLEESQRDCRLSSFSDNEHLLNDHQKISDIDNEEKYIDLMSMKRHSKVECNLQQAQWEQV